jgi:hypothetical protein
MTEIRSYRRVFDLERRIYSIDRVRLNPAGVPMRGVVYGLVAVLVFAVSRHAPIVGRVTWLLPWYIWYLALPLTLASTFTVLRIDGRRFHTSAAAVARHLISSRHLVAMKAGRPAGFRWRPTDLLIVPDGSEGRMRRMRFRGPGAVFVTCGYERVTHARASIGRHSTVHLREHPQAVNPSGVEVLALGVGASVVVGRRAGQRD